MKVLIISANTLPASPTGPAYIAGAALRAGHTVEVFECLFSQDIATDLTTTLGRFAPDVIGISIRLVHAYIVDENARFYTRHVDMRTQVKTLVDCIRQVSDARIVLGGPGFNYYARDWLEYLDLDYGIRGEADESFPLYLKMLQDGSDTSTIPGCVCRRDAKISQVPRQAVKDLDTTAFPAYELFDLQKYQAFGTSPAVLTKRGCVFHCTFCPYATLEGSQYRLKSPQRVVDEVESIIRQQSSGSVAFCENNFNVPKNHAEDICREIINRHLSVGWGTGDLRPLNITPDFCMLLRDSGCTYVNLSVESASETMLKQMKRGYTVSQVEQSLACLEKSGIPFGVGLLFGTPGETPQTIAESIAVVDRYSIPLGTWVTIGVCLWSHLQAVVDDAYRNGQIKEDSQLFQGVNYMSPELPKSYMIELIDFLHTKKGYTVQVNHPYAGYSS